MTVSAEQGPETEVDAELAATQSHEVEHGAFSLAGGAMQTSAELLEE